MSTASKKVRTRVLIAMDGSENSLFAFDWYIENVHHKDIEILIAHCPDFSTILRTPMMSSDPVFIAQVVKHEEDTVAVIVNKIKEKLTGSGVVGRILRLQGEPGEAIVKAAENENVNLIVTGTRGMGKVRRTLVGSVSDYILHHSHVPVLVCRQKEERHKEESKK